MDIGVPVFAALDGRVISVQDGEYDRRYGPTQSQFDNHVVVEHGHGPLHDLRPSPQGHRG